MPAVIIPIVLAVAADATIAYIAFTVALSVGMPAVGSGQPMAVAPDLKRGPV
jgi:hypothetical protein